MLDRSLARHDSRPSGGPRWPVEVVEVVVVVAMTCPALVSPSFEFIIVAALAKDCGLRFDQELPCQCASHTHRQRQPMDPAPYCDIAQYIHIICGTHRFRGTGSTAYSNSASALTHDLPSPIPPPQVNFRSGLSDSFFFLRVIASGSSSRHARPGQDGKGGGQDIRD